MLLFKEITDAILAVITVITKTKTILVLPVGRTPSTIRPQVNAIVMMDIITIQQQELVPLALLPSYTTQLWINAKDVDIIRCFIKENVIIVLMILTMMQAGISA